jgi:hypothetical protein
MRMSGSMHVVLDDETVWTIPNEAAGELEWRLRYGTPSRTDHLLAASIIECYRQMVVRDTAERRAYVVRGMRQMLAANSGGTEHVD